MRRRRRTERSPSRGVNGEPLTEPKSGRACRIVADPADEVVAAPFVESWRLEFIGEEHHLPTAALQRHRLRRGEQPTAKALSAEARLHPQTLQLAAASPRPAVDAGAD